MITLIVDPGLFEISEDMDRDDQKKHFFFLENTFSFAEQFFDAAIDDYNGAPYSYFYDNDTDYRIAPITKSRIIQNRYVDLQKQIQKMLRKGKLVELSEKEGFTCPLQFEEGTVTEHPFVSYLYTLLAGEIANAAKYLVVLSQKNISSAPSITLQNEESVFDIMAVGNPAADTHNLITTYLRERTDKKSIFPQSDSCVKLNDHIQSKLSDCTLSIAEKRALYIEYGYEVASRNSYKKQPEISRKNPRYIVFSHQYCDYYLSIDLEHGGLEVFIRRGAVADHLGEYDYSCKCGKGAEPENHRIIV